MEELCGGARTKINNQANNDIIHDLNSYKMKNAKEEENENRGKGT